MENYIFSSKIVTIDSRVDFQEVYYHLETFVALISWKNSLEKGKAIHLFFLILKLQYLSQETLCVSNTFCRVSS